MPALDVVAIDPSARHRIRDVWTSLEAASQPSYFLSWDWVETWLDALPASVPLKLYVARSGGAPVTAFFLGARRQWRHRLLPSQGLHLNQTGVPDYDELCIEYNGWVHDGSPPRFTDIALRLPEPWNELHLPALDLARVPASTFEGVPLRVRVERRVPCHVVDLDKVRAAGDYLTLLGGSTRSQIRRAAKLYASRGKLVVDSAASVDQALSIFDELVTLHCRAWERRGETGAFLPFVRGFHQRLIRTRFAAGDIQLLRVRAGSTTIGCLYNLLWGGTVAFYQGGLAYEDDPRLKPGLLCHAEAVRHEVALGHRWYDLLAGDSRYKQSLATDARTLAWVRVQRPQLRFRIEDAARHVRDRARAYRATLADRSPGGDDDERSPRDAAARPPSKRGADAGG